MDDWPEAFRCEHFERLNARIEEAVQAAVQAVDALETICFAELYERQFGCYMEYIEDRTGYFEWLSEASLLVFQALNDIAVELHRRSDEALKRLEMTDDDDEYADDDEDLLSP
jgi:hypothetical protein